MSTLSVAVIRDVQSFDFSNTEFAKAYNVANASFDQSNSASISANLSYNAQNVVFAVANASYASINSNWTVTNTVYGVANAAFAAANNVGPQIAPAFNTANAAFASANNVGPQLAPAFNTANAAFGKANTSLQNTSGTFAGILTVSGASLNVVGGANPYYSLNDGANGTSYLQIAGGVTNLYGGGSQPVSFSTGGYTRAHISGSGSFGIGYTTPVARLHVASSNGSPTAVSIGSRFFEDTNNYGLNIGATSTYGYIQGLLGTTSTLGYNNIVLQPNGSNVGIGKAPGYALDVNGTINATAITGTSMPSGSWVLLNTLTASSSSVLQDISNITSSYTHYAFVFTRVLPATNAVQLYMRYYVSGAFQTGSYWWVGTGSNLGTGAFSSGSTGGSEIRICAGVNGINSSYEGHSGITFLTNPASTGYKMCFGIGGYIDGNPQQTSVWHQGSYRGSTAAVTGIQFYMSSGNIASGTIHIYGIK